MKSVAVTAGEMLPARPPTPQKMNLPFHAPGSRTSKPAEPFGAPKPVVVMNPRTRQYSGIGGAAGMSTTDAMTMLGTFRAVIAATVQSGMAAHAGTAARQMNTAPRPRKGVERRSFI